MLTFFREKGGERVRKVLTSMIATLVILGAFFAFSGVATAHAPTDTTFTWVLTQNVGEYLRNEGTWSASGVVTDSGIIVQYLKMLPNKPAVAEVILTGAHGTIRMRTVAQTITVIEDWPFFTVRIDGIWYIAGGTGAYQQLSGHGTQSVVVEVWRAIEGEPDTNFGTQTGVCHLPQRGSPISAPI